MIHNRHGKNLSAVQAIGFYQGSMPHADNARYFLFDYKSCLSVKGDDRPDYKDRDVRAEWIGLPSNFSGGLSICPKQHQAGFLIEYNQKLSRFFDHSFLKHFWISITMPFVSVENDIQLRQYDIQNPGTGDGPRDIIQAMSQHGWCFGKIGPSQSRFSLSYVKLALGGTYMSEDNFQISYYSHFILSAAEGDCGKYMFAPVVGTNGHHGLGAGVNFQFPINRKNDRYDLCLFADLEHYYLFKQTLFRTLDLKDKPWSRYMMYNQIDRGPNLSLPGVNILTREVRVRSWNFVDMTFGMRFKMKELEVEAGYGIWGRGDGRLEWKYDCQFPEIYGIAGKWTLGDTEPKTASASTIDTLADNDKDADDNDTFVTIKPQDVCLRTGADKSVINHRVHVALSKNHIGEKIDGMFCAGAYVEMPQRNSSLKLWGLWGKFGTAF